MEDMITRIHALFGFECAPCPADLKGDQLMDHLREEQKRGDKEGFTPVFFFANEQIAETFEDIYGDDRLQTINAIIKSAEKIDGEAFLQQAAQEMENDMAEYGEGWEEPEPEEVNGERASNALPLDSLRHAMDGQLMLGHIPTSKPWEAAAWLPNGGVNEMPQPAEMTAVFKYFYERHGARPAFMNYDMWMFTVDKPFETFAESYEMMKRFIAFDLDVTIDSSINEMAHALIGAAVWQFWWD